MKPLQVQVLRGTSLESLHHVHLLAVDATGKTVLSFGDTQRPVFPRSAIKPVQAMLFASLAQPRSPADFARLSLAAASHWAEPAQLMTLEKWHSEIGLSDHDLICGPQTPRDLGEQRRLILNDLPVRRVHNNCSGKHTGFLQYCQHRNLPLTGYGDFQHPLQIELRELLSQMSGVDWHQLPWGQDGCGIPTSLVPLSALLRLTSSFAASYQSDDRVKRVVDAIRLAPEMLSSSIGFCSRVIIESAGEWIVKTGAEGAYLGFNLNTGYSFFLKVEDGATRASEHTVMWLCENLGSSDKFLHTLKQWQQKPLVNWAGENIGRLQVQLP